MSTLPSSAKIAASSSKIIRHTCSTMGPMRLSLSATTQASLSCSALHSDVPETDALCDVSGGDDARAGSEQAELVLCHSPQ